MPNLSPALVIDNGDGDEPMSNDSANAHFKQVLDAHLSRRSALRGGLGASIAALFGGVGLAGCASTAGGPSGRRIGFEPVAVSSADTVVVPKGYKVQTKCRQAPRGLQGDWWRELRHQTLALRGLESHPLVLAHHGRVGRKVALKQSGGGDRGGHDGRDGRSRPPPQRLPERDDVEGHARFAGVAPSMTAADGRQTVTAPGSATVGDPLQPLAL